MNLIWIQSVNERTLLKAFRMAVNSAAHIDDIGAKLKLYLTSMEASLIRESNLVKIPFPQLPPQFGSHPKPLIQ